MAKRLKRAFTITERVIVIAVVAILAAVLIPTFTNIIKKADESADTQLVKNLNTILSSEQTVSQEAAPTMSKALEQAQSGGYTVDKLTPTSDGDILWEQDSNRFVLVSGGEIIFKDSATTADIATESYKFWKIVDNENDAKNGIYSAYLKDGFVGGNSVALDGVAHGIDVGNNGNVTSITYTTEAAQSVIFNTKGGTLTVNAANSDVKHYGDAKVVNVKDVKDQSYHLFGTISDTLKVTKGHIYIESTGTVNVLDGTAVTEESGKATATIDMSSSATVGTVVIAKDVAEAALGTALKGAVESGAVDAVEEIPEEASLFAGGIGTEKSPFLIETAVQFKNIEKIKNSKIYYKVTNSFVLKEAVSLQDGIDADITFDTVTLTLDEAAVIDLYGNSKLTVRGDVYIDWAENLDLGYIFRTSGSSKLIIESGYYIGGLTCVQAGGNAVVEIYGGTFEGSSEYSGTYWILNLIDNSAAKILVYGGLFFKYDPAESLTENPAMNFVADGYESVIINAQNDLIWYEVRKK